MTKPGVITVRLHREHAAAVGALITRTRAPVQGRTREYGSGRTRTDAAIRGRAGQSRRPPGPVWARARRRGKPQATFLPVSCHDDRPGEVGGGLPVL